MLNTHGMKMGPISSSTQLIKYVVEYDVQNKRSVKMSQVHLDKPTMQKHHEEAAKHHQEASKHHQEAASFHKNDKHVDGQAAAHKAQGHAAHAKHHASEAAKHGAGIPSAK